MSKFPTVFVTFTLAGEVLEVTFKHEVAFDIANRHNAGIESTAFPVAVACVAPLAVLQELQQVAAMQFVREAKPRLFNALRRNFPSK